MGFRKKRQWRTLIHSRVTLGILLVLVVLLGKGVWGVGMTAWETYRLRSEHERTLKELQMRATSLQAEIDRLSSPRGLEEEIRSTFDVAREGEEVMVIIDPKEPEGESDDSEKSDFWSALFFWE